MVEEKKTKRTGRKPASSSKKAKKDLTITVDKDAIWKLLSLALGVVIIFVLFRNFYPSGSDQPTTTSTLPATDYGIAKLDFYVMSQCPYGTQVEDAILPVLKKLGSSVDFSLNFIANEGAGGTFTSLHGQPEVEGDIVQLCAAKYNPDKYMDMVVCQNENARAIPDNWEACARKFSLDVEKIRVCYTGSEGKSLLSASIKKTAAVGASASPTMYLDGQQYNGGRDTLSFMRAVCQKLSNHPECQNMPACGSDADCTAQPSKIGKCENPGQNNAKCVYLEPVPINAIVLNDKRCVECDVTDLVGQLKSFLPGLTVQNIDYMSPEGKTLYDELQLEALPALLLDSNVQKSPRYQNIANYLVKTGDYWSLRIGAQFNPTKEICNNQIDDTGDGEVDCDDPDCEQSMDCREEIERNLQVFIMSDCPYGRKAIEALKVVVDNFGDKITYEVHYIASAAGEGFSSLHGQYEVDEDIIQLCALKHSPKAWFGYLYCRSTKGVKDKDWKDCAGETGVDIASVQSCFDSTEGKALLREDIKIANSIGVSASPTWLANNRNKFSGIDAQTVKTSFCRYNLDLEGCENTLSSETGGLPSGGGC